MSFKKSNIVLFLIFKIVFFLKTIETKKTDLLLNKL